MSAFKVIQANMYVGGGDVVGVFNGEVPRKGDTLRIRNADYQVQSVMRVYGSNNVEAQAEVTAVMLGGDVGNC